MAEEETKQFATGFRFNPLDEELITHYLKPMILREQLPCDIIKFKQVYGPSSDPWHVFDPYDHRMWFTSPDIKNTEKFTFAFAKLSKLSKSVSSTFKNTSKRAGCGTWVGKTSRDQITDDEDNVIGEKRYLVFEIKDIDSSAARVGGFDDLSKVGCFRMHEYSLCGVNAGFASADTTVLCKITHDSSKVCQITKQMGTKSGDHISRSSSTALKKEESNNNLEESGTVKAENLTLTDSGGVDNLDESRTLNSQSLNVVNSDISDWHAAPQVNNSVQEVEDLGGDFCFGEQGDYNFSLDDLGFYDTDWMLERLSSSQKEESLEESMINKPGKRKIELEEHLNQAKKMRLE